MQKIILASSSPRRKEILEKMGLDFVVISSEYEEVWDNLDFEYKKVEQMACGKAQSVLEKLPASNYSDYSFILSADTVVVLENKILTKPKDKDDAKRMLKSLGGKKHSVVTSICLISLPKQNKMLKSVTSYVEFNNLSDEQIYDYIEKYKPFDKAGSYGIQELPKEFIKTIEGSYENIVGLCSQAVNDLIKEQST